VGGGGSFSLSWQYILFKVLYSGPLAEPLKQMNNKVVCWKCKFPMKIKFSRWRIRWSAG